VEGLEASLGPDTPTQLAFRKLRADLYAAGWWQRDMRHEAKLLAIWGAVGLSAVFFAHSPLPHAGKLSAFLLSLFFTQSGWLGHDYVHGVDKFSDRMRYLATTCGGLAVTWWSTKHNKHHALTNEIGVDEVRPSAAKRAQKRASGSTNDLPEQPPSFART
jgi:fatty acid desaturase